MTSNIGAAHSPPPGPRAKTASKTPRAASWTTSASTSAPSSSTASTTSSSSTRSAKSQLTHIVDLRLADLQKHARRPPHHARAHRRRPRGHLQSRLRPRLRSPPAQARHPAPRAGQARHQDPRRHRPPRRPRHHRRRTKGALTFVVGCRAQSEHCVHALPLRP